MANKTIFVTGRSGHPKQKAAYKMHLDHTKITNLTKPIHASWTPEVSPFSFELGNKFCSSCAFQNFESAGHEVSTLRRVTRRLQENLWGADGCIPMIIEYYPSYDEALEHHYKRDASDLEKASVSLSKLTEDKKDSYRSRYSKLFDSGS